MKSISSLAAPVRNLVALMVGICVVVALIVVIAIPFVVRARKRDRWESALSSFASIVEAQEAFRANDIDGNGKLDYWTRDIRGLADFKIGGTQRPLLETELARADGAYPDARSRFGYFYAVLRGEKGGHRYDDGSGRGPEYAFCMYPDENSPEEWKRTVVWSTRHGRRWKDTGGQRVFEWPRDPAAEGWGWFQ